MRTYDIIIIGGSLGGVLAAYSSAKAGNKVLLIEESKWIGGQLTSQAVPLDEHKYIESEGATLSYMNYREKVRNYYRNHPYIIDELKTKEHFCPGGSSVSRLSHPPKLALSFIYEMLNPYIDSGLLTIYLESFLIDVVVENDFIQKITFKNIYNEITDASSKYYLDGTDHGDLIKLSKESYFIGADSYDTWLEPHARKESNKKDLQPVTWVLAASYDPLERKDYTIPKPEMYDYFKSLKMPYDKYDVLSMFGPDSSTGKAKEFGFFNNELDNNGNKLFGLWTYRRIINASNFKNNFYDFDVSLINWPQNDYFLNNIIETDDDEKNLYMAKQLTLSLFYYLQTEAIRKDGTKGYKGLFLRPDILGTDDGLAMMPYIREGRRLDSEFVVTEQMIAKKENNVPYTFFDSVGVGSYSIDLHITTQNHDFYYIETNPFEIPLGSLIPKKIKNLIASSKNIGTTHLTNGCYRVHPVEWNIGESAGLLADYAIKNNLLPTQIRNNPSYLKEFQRLLTDNGIQLRWSFNKINHWREK